MAKVYNHYTADQKIQYIKEYYYSNLSASEFCRQNNIVKSTFFAWLKLYKKELSKTEYVENGFYRISDNLEHSDAKCLPLPEALGNVTNSIGVINKEINRPIVEVPSEVNRSVKLKLNGFEIECDVDLLGRVIGALR